MAGKGKVEIDENLVRGGFNVLTPVSCWVFNAPDGTEILRIGEQGMTYKGQLIEDAGEAHKAFLDAMAEVRLYYARE